MLVRPKKAASGRKPAAVQAAPAEPYTFPAPIRGWVLNENLANAQPGGARWLDNWVCTTTGARVRRGKAKYATLPAPVRSMFSYRAAGTSSFAATNAAIYDITGLTDAVTTPPVAVGSLTSGAFSVAQFGTAGGNFLYAVNGADSARLFDGSTWTTITGVSTPAITGVTTSLLLQVWTFASRVWFVEKNSLSAWYLPIDSIGGAAVEFPLAGVFTKGGSLLFGAKWSMDAGDGLDDKCVFVTTEGEVAVYEGTNPASAATWALAGRYDLPRPLGSNAVVGAGGDLLIATIAGLIPISAAISSDLGAVEAKAVSGKIGPYWQELVRQYPAGWTARKFNAAGYMMVAPPEGETAMVVNLSTGGWSRFTGWDVAAMDEFGGEGYFGGADGKIFRMEATGADDGEIYTASLMGQHDGLGAAGAVKTVLQMRTTFRYSTEFEPQVTASTDFDATLPVPPSAALVEPVDAWDVGLWDEAIWDAEGATGTQSIWSAIGVTGTFIAPVVQITFGTVTAPDVELVAIEAMVRTGVPVS